MAAIAHWEAEDGSWDKLILGPYSMPGVWEISDGEGKREIDIKKTKNKDGATLKDLGYLPARLVLRGKLIDVADWELLQDVYADIHPRKKGAPTDPLAIEHPVTAIMGIPNVYVDAIEVPRLRDGILEAVIHVIEWMPKAVKKKKGTDKPKATDLGDGLIYDPEHPSGAALLSQEDDRVQLGYSSAGVPPSADALAFLSNASTPPSSEYIVP